MNKLFEDFSSVTAKEWKQKIQVDLKGADYNDALVWETLEGIKIKPFYTSEDTNSLPISSNSNHPLNWKITEKIYVTSANTANKKALEAIEKGAQSILFSITSTISIAELTQGIILEETYLYFNFSFLDAAYFQTQFIPLSSENRHLYLQVDILGNLAKSGNWHHSEEKDLDLFLELDKVFKNVAGVYLLGINATLYQNAGANAVQQLAYTLAHSNEYFNYLEQNKTYPEEKIPFEFAIGGNYFLEIAKLRAFRILFASLSNEYNFKVYPLIITTPSKRNKTIYDYNTNLLRSTTECMAAILGGADEIYNSPYDVLYKKENSFSNRLGRNQLLVLKEESYFNTVSNAADGTYYIESLTHQLVQKSLELFKKTEADGGYLKLLKTHQIQKKIKDNAKKELLLFKDLKEVLIGTNKFQNKSNKMKAEIETDIFISKNRIATVIKPILEKRLAHTLELNRLENE